MNLFVLSDGDHINLDHVLEIPSRHTIAGFMKNGVPVMITMSNCVIKHIDPKDAWEIIAHLYSGEELSPKPKTKREWKIGDFVEVVDGRIGIITGTNKSGGIYPDHYGVWFGELRDSKPVSEPRLITDDWQLVPTPILFV